MGTGSQPSWWDQLHRFTRPVLLITGKEDAKFCRIAAEMEKQLQYAAWTVIPNAGHNTHLEQPAEFIRAVHHFLLDTNELPKV
jgi:2-succinyl-6-hydroxy-2,4-cyclohexadiene-1-carboxylate synthase